MQRCTLHALHKYRTTNKTDTTREVNPFIRTEGERERERKELRSASFLWFSPFINTMLRALGFLKKVNGKCWADRALAAAVKYRRLLAMGKKLKSSLIGLVQTFYYYYCDKLCKDLYVCRDSSQTAWYMTVSKGEVREEIKSAFQIVWVQKTTSCVMFWWKVLYKFEGCCSLSVCGASLSLDMNLKVQRKEYIMPKSLQIFIPSGLAFGLKYIPNTLTLSLHFSSCSKLYIEFLFKALVS